MDNGILSANGKITLVDTPIDSMETKTLKIVTGSKTKLLVIDVDDPTSKENENLLKKISPNDCFVVSSQYTLEDVFAGECRYKVVYRYNSEKELSNPRTKKDDNGNTIPQPVEIFYNSSKSCSVIGARHDGYEYKMYNKITDIHFDLNDVVSYKLNFKLTGKSQGNDKISRKEPEDKLVIPSDCQEVNAEELAQILMRILGKSTSITKKNSTLLTFPCLFPEMHSKQNNAYAYKQNGYYVCKCQGVVCESEYIELNNAIRNEYTTSVVWDFEGFNVDKSNGNKVKLFIAPTGFGKTEKIAQEVLNAVSRNEKLLVVCQSKEAITRIKNRVNYYSNGALPTLEMSGRLFTWISENNDGKLDQSFIKANVILTHHYYLSNAGDVLTYYPALQQVLSISNLNVIVDEAHTWLELASQLSIECGGLYQQITSNRYQENRERLILDQKLERKDKLEEITACLEPTLTDFGTIELRKQYKVYKSLDYVDLVSAIDERFAPIIDYKDEDCTEYKLYKNNEPSMIQANNLEDCSNVTNLILDPSEYILVSRLKGDDTPRKTIGRTIANIYHYSLLKLIFDRVNHVILTTATMTDYHFNILDRVCQYDTIRVDQQISKIETVVLLHKTKDTRKNIRKQILDSLNDTNARALMFMPTIDNAKDVVAKYDNMICCDNGWYTISKRVSQEDYVDNFKRNVIVCGLESSVSKGYNFMEEVGDNAEGFDIVYFDSEPVSPDVLKKYVSLDGKIVDYYDTYAMTTFTQAIGRALRKEKKQLTLCLNNISPKLIGAIQSYLQQTLNCRIVVDELNLTNLKVSTLKDIVDSDNDLSENLLYQELYMKGA